MTHGSHPVFRKGQWVSFKNWPLDLSTPSPLRVEGVTIRGWLRLAGKPRSYPPQLFEVVQSKIQEELKP
jgi:hypothetical protein